MKCTVKCRCPLLIKRCFLLVTVFTLAVPCALLHKQHFQLFFQRISLSTLLSQNNQEGVELTRVYVERQKQMLNFCQQSNQRPVLNSSSPSYNKTLYSMVASLIVDDKYKIIFCKIAKAGVSNWKRMLLYMRYNSSILQMRSRQIHTPSEYDVKLLTEYSIKDIEYRLKNYMKIIFVRHPLDRLLSAYMDKFRKPSNFSIKQFLLLHGREIIRKYRKNPSIDSLQLGHDVKFDEFLRYVADSAYDKMDKHWSTFEQRCFPCQIQYDFIGKHETMSEDSSYLLDKWRLSRQIQFPKPYRSALDEFCRYTDFYSSIDGHLVERVSKRYSNDAALFGYDKYPLFKFNDIALCNRTSPSTTGKSVI